MTPRNEENQQIRTAILNIYAACKNRPGAYKVRAVPERAYIISISISIDRLYRLMKNGL